MNETKTSPDVTIINNNIDFGKVEWWIEDYGRGKFASDHLTIFTLIQDVSVNKELKLEYCIRTGDNLDWGKWRKELEKNAEIWFNEFGNKLDDFVNLFKNKNNLNVNVDIIKNRVGIDDGFIIKAVEELINVIVNTAKDIFGIRIKNQYQTNPWMTSDIKNAIDDYMRFKKKFYNFSKRKKKKFKDKLNYLCKLKDELVSKGKISWVEGVIQKQQNKGSMTWSDINKIINYETCSTKNIPNWIDPDTKKVIADSAEVKASLYLDYIHRFDDIKDDNNINNDDYNKIWNDYKLTRDNSNSSIKKQNELDILNGIITKNEIKRSVNSFEADSAVFEDNVSHKYLQKVLIS